MNVTEGAGAAKPKTGLNAAVLSRPQGMAQAVSFIGGKTASRYPCNKGVNYHYQGCSGFGSNENILGYSKR